MAANPSPPPSTDERTLRSFAFGAFVLIPERQALFNETTLVRIGGRALDLLTALVERPGVLITKQDLMARAWPTTVVEEANLKVNMASLRRILGERAGASRCIATVPGRGYRFVADVRASQSAVYPFDPQVARPPSNSLPIRTSSLLGREREIELIRRDLESSRLVTIAGPGGVGKTTVAVAAARDYGREVAFIDLATIGDPQFIPAVIAGALGVGMNSTDPLAGVIHALRSEDKLLLFDNCEHLLPAIAATVDRLVRSLSGVRVLVTSREPLRIDKESIHRLSGLECDPSAKPTAHDAFQYPAVELFATRAKFKSGYRFCDPDAPAVAEICRRLDGNALAIELAAAQISSFTPEDVLRMLDDRLRLLRVTTKSSPLRQQSLQATLDWSYSLLSERESSLLESVSVFAASFGLDGAATAAGAPPAEVLDVLARLDAKSLITSEVEGATVTYRLLESTRSYSLDRLKMSGRDDGVRRRHATYVCQKLEQAEAEWARRTSRDWANTYSRLIDDLRGALAWAESSSRHTDAHVRLTVAGLLLWNHLGLTQECRVRVSKALGELEVTGLVGTPAEMKLQVWFGGVTIYTQGLNSPAMSAVQRAFSIAGNIGDAECQVRCLRLIGIYQIFNGENDAAIGTFSRFSELALAEAPSALLEGDVALGIAQMFTGQLPSLRGRLEHRRRLDLHVSNESQRVRYISDRVGDVQNLLAQVQWLSGSPETALKTSAAALDYAVETQHPVAIVNALSYITPIYYWAGRFAECQRYANLFEEQSLRHGFSIRRPVAMFYLSALKGEWMDRPQEAVEGLQRAIAEFHSTGHLARMPYYMAVMAQNHARCEEIDRAREVLALALQRAIEKNDKWSVPEILRIRASLLGIEGKVKLAEETLFESMAISQEMGALAWRLRAGNDLAQLWISQRRIDEARQMLAGVFSEFREGHGTRDLSRAAELLASMD